MLVLRLLVRFLHPGQEFYDVMVASAQARFQIFGAMETRWSHLNCLKRGRVGQHLVLLCPTLFVSELVARNKPTASCMMHTQILMCLGVFPRMSLLRETMDLTSAMSPLQGALMNKLCCTAASIPLATKNVCRVIIILHVLSFIPE